MKKSKYKLRKNGPRGVILQIPKKILDSQNLKAGDYVQFYINPHGNLVIKKVISDEG